MMRGLLIGAALLMASGTAPNAAWAATAPDLAACPRPEAPESGEPSRTGPLPVPAELRGLMKSGLHHYAVATLGGGTVCIDTSWMEAAVDVALSADKRFLSFSWSGYETGGFLLVDRSGKGQVVETGAQPTFSPSGKRFAAIEWSESGFGALNALGVWQVEPEGVKPLALMEDVPRMTAWAIDRWAGEDCIEISGVATDHAPTDPREIDFAPRTRFVAARLARPSAPAAWRILLGIESCPKR